MSADPHDDPHRDDPAERDASDPRLDRMDRMDEATCLLTFSLLLDGRPVQAGLERAARAYARRHPHCERVLADWQRQARALAALPARRASPDFTERVLAAAAITAPAASRAPHTPAVHTAPISSMASKRRESQTLRPFARQLALAASIALLLSLIVVLARPADLRADAGIARHRHAVDGFRATPFAPDDIAAGLRARLADAEFGARLGQGRP